MARLFLDTSALIKLYRDEHSSSAVRACVSAEDTLLIAGITPLEYRSAFCGMVRRKTLTQTAIEHYLLAFNADLPQYSLILMSRTVIQRAESLISRWAIRYDLRPLDALQLASALETDQETAIDALVTTDVVLRIVAERCQLTVLPSAR